MELLNLVKQLEDEKVSHERSKEEHKRQLAVSQQDIKELQNALGAMKQAKQALDDTVLEEKFRVLEIEKKMSQFRCDIEAQHRSKEMEQEVYKHQLEAAQAGAKEKLKTEMHTMQNEQIRLEEKLAQGKERERWLQLEVTRLLGEVENRDAEMNHAATASATAIQASLEDYEQQRVQDGLEIQEHLGEVDTMLAEAQADKARLRELEQELEAQRRTTEMSLQNHRDLLASSRSAEEHLARERDQLRENLHKATQECYGLRELANRSEDRLQQSQSKLSELDKVRHQNAEIAHTAKLLHQEGLHFQGEKQHLQSQITSLQSDVARYAESKKRDTERIIENNRRLERKAIKSGTLLCRHIFQENLLRCLVIGFGKWKVAVVTAKLDKAAKDGIHYAWAQAKKETDKVRRDFQRKEVQAQDEIQYERVLRQGMEAMVEAPSGDFASRHPVLGYAPRPGPAGPMGPMLHRPPPL